MFVIFCCFAALLYEQIAIFFYRFGYSSHYIVHTPNSKKKCLCCPQRLLNCPVRLYAVLNVWNIRTETSQDWIINTSYRTVCSYQAVPCHSSKIRILRRSELCLPPTPPLPLPSPDVFPGSGTPFGLGSARTLQSFADRLGVDFRTATVKSSDARNAGRPPTDFNDSVASGLEGVLGILRAETGSSTNGLVPAVGNVTPSSDGVA